MSLGIGTSTANSNALLLPMRYPFMMPRALGSILTGICLILPWLSPASCAESDVTALPPNPPPASANLIRLGVQLPFSHYDDGVRAHSAHLLRAFEYAIEEMNNETQSAPLKQQNIQFGLNVVDSYQASPSLDFVTGRNIPISNDTVTPNTALAQSILSTMDLIKAKSVGLFAEVTSELTLGQALVSSRLRIPQCLFMAFHPDLSDKEKVHRFKVDLLVESTLFPPRSCVFYHGK
jgi:hypothetical protein